MARQKDSVVQKVTKKQSVDEIGAEFEAEL